MSSLDARNTEPLFATHPVKDLIVKTFRSLCSFVDSPISRALIRATPEQLGAATITPSDYSNAIQFRRDYLLVSYLSKYSGLVTGIDTKAVALSSFAAAELKCEETNARLKKHVPTIVDPILHRASKLIAGLLGEFSLDKLHGRERWGPGATFEFPRTEAYMDTKIASAPFTVTAAAAPLFLSAIRSDRAWFELLRKGESESSFDLQTLLKIVPGSRIDTVPKNAKTDRTIAIEPRGNMFLQKACGAYIRSRLKRVGVNLDDQSINQDLASIAQLRQLATLDLKAASDTVCSELIHELLPVDWACYLDRLRSRSYTLNGVDFQKFHKFSSMGNGFTFELESLIFWALTQATCESSPIKARGSDRVCAVYGDDIICPQSEAWVLTTVLNYCGFEINLTKSFYEGNFFESCGRHFFDGTDVTPIYQKEQLTSKLAAIRAFNRLIRYAYIYVPELGFADKEKLVDIAYKKLFLQTFDKNDGIPHIPPGVEGNDGYILPKRLLIKHNLRRRVCPNRGVQCVVLREVQVSIPAYEDALYVYKLRENSTRSNNTSILSRETSSTGDTDHGLVELRSINKPRTILGARWVHPI